MNSIHLQVRVHPFPPSVRLLSQCLRGKQVYYIYRYRTNRTLVWTLFNISSFVITTSKGLGSSLPYLLGEGNQGLLRSSYNSSSEKISNFHLFKDENMWTMTTRFNAPQSRSVMGQTGRQHDVALTMALRSQDNILRHRLQNVFTVSPKAFRTRQHARV